MTPKAILAIRAMQNLLNSGWPNNGLLESKKYEYSMIQNAFYSEMNRDMTFRDIQYKGI